MHTDSRALLAHILAVLGAATVSACAGRAVGEEGDTAAGSESGSGSESGLESESESESEETDDGDGPVLDLPAGETDCSELMVYSFIGDSFDPPSECVPENQYQPWSNICFFPPEGRTCDNHGFSDECILAAYICGVIQGGDEIVCGPITTEEGACCHVVWGGCGVGRPWVVEGRARRAEVAHTSDWLDESTVPQLAEIDAATRAALADAWASEGLSEHASVASFSRFTLQLLALGAPPALVAASIRAGLDEVRHARACFAMASAYAGTAIGPTALDIRSGLAEPFDLDTVALSLASEGCIAETVSLVLLAAARDRARDPEVRAILGQIVEDELEHVTLAWEALAWMCRSSSHSHRMLESLAEVFREAERHVGFGATTELVGDPATMRAHGYLSIDERRELATRALAEVVTPAARELFASLKTDPKSPRHRHARAPADPAARTPIAPS